MRQSQRLLAAVTVATTGELFLEIGDGADWDDAYRVGVRHLQGTSLIPRSLRWRNADRAVDV